MGITVIIFYIEHPYKTRLIKINDDLVFNKKEITFMKFFVLKTWPLNE